MLSVVDKAGLILKLSLENIFINQSIAHRGFPDRIELQKVRALLLSDEPMDDPQVIHLVDQYGSDDNPFLIKTNLAIDISFLVPFCQDPGDSLRSNIADGSNGYSKKTSPNHSPSDYFHHRRSLSILCYTCDGGHGLFQHPSPASFHRSALLHGGTEKATCS